MKIAIVAQHANPLHPRADASPRSDDAGLSELTRILARQGHRVTVYAQKLSRTRRTRRRPARRAHPGRRGRQAGDTEPLAHVPAFSDPLRARWRRERPDVVHAVSWTSGLAALMATRDLGIRLCRHSARLASRSGGTTPARTRPRRRHPGSGWSWPSADSYRLRRRSHPRRPGSSPTRAHSPRTSATPDPEARHVSAPTPVPSS